MQNFGVKKLTAYLKHIRKWCKRTELVQSTMYQNRDWNVDEREIHKSNKRLRWWNKSH